MVGWAMALIRYSPATSQPVWATVAWKSRAIGAKAVEIMVELIGFSVEPRARGRTKEGPKCALGSCVGRATVGCRSLRA